MCIYVYICIRIRTTESVLINVGWGGEQGLFSGINVYTCIQMYIHICMYVYIYIDTPEGEFDVRRRATAVGLAYLYVCVYMYIHMCVNLYICM